MRSIVIFGTGDMGLLTCLLLREDARREIAAFTVERGHLTAKQFCDAAVVPFDEVSTAYPPASCEILIAVGPDRRNQLRARLFAAAAAMGYDFASYIHSSVTVHGSASIGRNCLIYENLILQPYTQICDNVMIRPLSYIGHHVSIGAHCFVAPGVKLLGHCSIGEQTFIGAGAVVGPGVSIGAKSVIGANASILKDLPEGSFVAPNSVAK
jgi:sugar O-acyltransferase (sialic acid O-acetyltransferase NeuD family)